MLKRGVIHHRERARQIRDFSELLYGNITPTDIDGLIEYHGKGYVFIETKLQGTELEFGQRLALERMTDDLTRADKPSICIIADHDREDSQQDINVADTIVREYRWHKQWLPGQGYTSKALINKFLAHLDRPEF